MTNTGAGRPVLPEGLYGITAQEYSRGRSNGAVVSAMLAAGVRVIQYREKDKGMREMLAEARELRDLTAAAGALFIVNDHVDLALLAQADGVHVGQDDLPVEEVRRLVGDAMLIGASTHAPEQALAAAAAGADYIGAGPLFFTRTKKDVCAPVGLSYLQWALENVPLPCVAIGGIKSHNLAEVVRAGARHAALVTEVVGAEDIAGMVRQLQKKWRQAP